MSCKYKKYIIEKKKIYHIFKVLSFLTHLSEKKKHTQKKQQPKDYTAELTPGMWVQQLNLSRSKKRRRTALRSVLVPGCSVHKGHA